jgi:hypothetical protein
MAKEKKIETIAEETVIENAIVEETVVEETVVSEPKWDGLTCRDYVSLKYKQ